MIGVGGSYGTLFDSLGEGYCVVEILFAAADESVGARFLETNAAFEQLTGLRGARGKTTDDLLPELEAHWLRRLGAVARTGQPERFVADTVALGSVRWFDVCACRIGGHDGNRVAVHFDDITDRRRTEEELRYRSDQFHALIERAPLGVYVVDADERLVDANPAARAALGDAPDLLGRAHAEVLRLAWPTRLADEILRRSRRTLETGDSHHEPELSAVREDGGATEYYEWHLERIPLRGGRFGVASYFRDISAQVETRLASVASERRYRTLFDSIDEGFCIMQVIFDEHDQPLDYRYAEINPVFEQQTGIRNALGRTIRELVPNIEAYWFDVYGTVALSGEPRRFTFDSKSMGRWFDVFAFRIGEPPACEVAVLFTDVTERKRAEEALRESESRLRHRAHHDPLTGLPNRLLLEDRLELAVATAERHGRGLAVLFLDLDGFKMINDGLGHAVGDAVLEEVSRRLQACLRAGDTLARMHGDEFVVLVPELANAFDAGRLARTLLAEVAKPIEVAGQPVRVNASVGVAVYPSDARDATALLRAADIAMYRAKLGGKNDVRYFDPSMRAPAVERVALAEHLDGALERGELSIHYQPEWDTRTGGITTLEALLRWASPSLGEVSPERFVRIAEERGAFGSIFAWSLETVGGCARALSEGRGPPFRIALNVTPARIVRSTFLPRVEAVIARHGIQPEQLEFELTVLDLGGRDEGLREPLEAVRALGARVTLDRFGADAGMIAALLDMPLDGVKLDPRLVHRADHDPRFRRGLASVVGLVHDLGLDLVAVGIESESQRDVMIELGCERLQGYLIGPPVPRSEVEGVLRGRRISTLFEQLA